MDEILKKAIKIQNLITNGSFELNIGKNSIVFDRDSITLNIFNSNVIKVFFKKHRKKGNIFKKISEIAQELYDLKKTVIVKYRNKEMVIIGFRACPSILGMKNIEIKSNVTFIRFIKSVLW